VTDFLDLGFEILFRDFTGSCPASLVVDGVDPDWLAWAEARFIQIGLVEDPETIALGITTLREGFLGLESPT